MPRLSDPLQVKGLRLRNRLVMAPMVTGFAEDHRASPRQAAWYADHARAGAGMIIVESCAIVPDALLLPRLLGIWEDAQIPGLARIADAIRAEGIPAILQIVHGGARSWREDLSLERVGPSPVPLMPGPAPRAMTEADIEAAIAAFARAARRAVEAGFDGVELHGAHYYLISEFLSPYTNRRTDCWGGDREGRSRMGREVVRAVRREVGAGFPLLCRMHAVEFVEGGMSSEDSVYFAGVLEKEGVDLIDASGIGTSSQGNWEGRTFLNTSSVLPKGDNAGAFAPFTGKIRNAVHVPVIAVGKMGKPGLAQDVLDQGQADLIALARQLIADPQAIRKILDGREEEIERCQECNLCFSSIRQGALRCGVNHSLEEESFETERSPR